MHNFWLVVDTIRGASACYEQTQLAIRTHENKAEPFVLAHLFYNQRTVYKPIGVTWGSAKGDWSYQTSAQTARAVDEET